MFERFKEKYKVTSRIPSDPSSPIMTRDLEETPGYQEFMREYAGATFNNGVYRIHTLEGRAKWNRILQYAFSTYKGRIAVFGYDWLGRQFALHADRREDGQPMVLLFDIEYGEALQIPGTFIGCHDNFLITDADAALCDNVFEDWLKAGNRAPGPTECVGMKVSPFLGGRDVFENFEVTDMEVYWDLSTQIIAATRDLPDGTPIGKVTLEDE